MERPIFLLAWDHFHGDDRAWMKAIEKEEREGIKRYLMVGIPRT